MYQPNPFRRTFDEQAKVPWTYLPEGAWVVTAEGGKGQALLAFRESFDTQHPQCQVMTADGRIRHLEAGEFIEGWK